MNKVSTPSPAVSLQGLEWQIKLRLFLFYLRGSKNGHNTVPRTPDEGKSLQNAQPIVRTEAYPSFRVTQGCPLWVPLGQALLGQIQLSNC